MADRVVVSEIEIRASVCQSRALFFFEVCEIRADSDNCVFAKVLFLYL
jgi:hypothetical protein